MQPLPFIMLGNWSQSLAVVRAIGLSQPVGFLCYRRTCSSLALVKHDLQQPVVHIGAPVCNQVYTYKLVLNWKMGYSFSYPKWGLGNFLRIWCLWVGALLLITQGYWIISVCQKQESQFYPFYEIDFYYSPQHLLESCSKTPSPDG